MSRPTKIQNNDPKINSERHCTSDKAAANEETTYKHTFNFNASVQCIQRLGILAANAARIRRIRATTLLLDATHVCLDFSGKRSRLS
jgi:hypothetical protein